MQLLLNFNYLVLIGIIAALASAASWALGAILFKKIGENVSPFGMTLTKGIFGVILLGLALLIQGIEIIPLNATCMLFISGIIGITIGDTLFFASLQYLGAKVQIIFFMLGQIITAILGLLILKEMPFLMQWIGIFITLLGVLVVLWDKIFSNSNSKTAIKGIVLGLLAMFCFSVSLIIAKKAMISISTLSAVFIRMTAGTLGMLIYGLFVNKVRSWLNPFQNRNMLLFFFGSVCIVTFGGFWLSLVSLKHLDVAVASALGTVEPLFVLPLAFFILKEKITKVELIGAALTIAGVIFIIKGSGI
jgi:drug/metabolite transporter (DMT)-like permease